MDYYEITYKVVFWYSHEPSPTGDSETEKRLWQSGEVKEVSDASGFNELWEVRYENTVGGNWDSREKFVEHLEQKLEEEGPEEMLDGCINEDENWDPDYDGCELEIDGKPDSRYELEVEP